MHFTSLNNARMAFKIMSQIVDEITCNFKNKFSKRNNSSEQNDGLFCPHCQNGQLFTCAFMFKMDRIKKRFKYEQY